MLSISEIRREAREILSGKWGIAIGVFLLSYLIITAGSSILGFIPVIGWLASFLFVGPLTVGVSWFYLALNRREDPDVGYMFSGFNDFGRTLLAYILVTLFTFLWALLFIIPGIIKMYSYSQTFYILRNNPNISALDAITESRHMMNGHKGRLFGLSLTFLLWYLIPIAIFMIGGAVMGMGAITNELSNYSGTLDVSVLTLGAFLGGSVVLLAGIAAAIIISIFIYPYMNVAYAVFHDDLYSRNTSFEDGSFVDTNSDVAADPYGTETEYSIPEEPFEETKHPEGFGLRSLKKVNLPMIPSKIFAGESSFDIRLAKPEDTEELSDLMINTAKWLKEQGSLQWNALLSGNDVHGLAAKIHDCEVYHVSKDGEIAGTMILQQAPSDWDTNLWQESAAEPAYYLHRLVVARKFSGQNLSHAMLQFAEQVTSDAEVPLLRLDIMKRVQVLNDLYQSAGFSLKGVRNGFSLYEKKDATTIKKQESVSSRKRGLADSCFLIYQLCFTILLSLTKCIRSVVEQQRFDFIACF
ncbi:hypothetical protein MFLO_12506 [Listeria floridensis FSL S10-1187]|uniref:N-acetyltransferase domain-containing protein n=1 Tax=Listeria floridensis FSL S10-1187 TaxID=1265817 RepID=A0ABN0RCZ5_9LIST|nr:DUF975 family protein [Listeria floridensis]EUJ28218.1 hypothetical protein MFLO_12506 [Listeria floridensis FSL S10-1187]